MRIYYGAYDLYPAIWTDTEGWIHVDGKWNRIARVDDLDEKAHSLTAAAFRSEDPDLETPKDTSAGDQTVWNEVNQLWTSEPFVALARQALAAKRAKRPGRTKEAVRDIAWPEASAPKK